MKKIFAFMLVGSICLTACDKETEQNSSNVEHKTNTTNIDNGWVELGKKTGGVAIDYYQPSSQRQMDGYQVVAFKTILMADDDKRKLKAGDYLIGEVVLDCKNKQVGLLKSTLYGADKTLKHEFDMSSNLQMKSVIQDEPTGRLLELVCNKT